MNNDVNNSELEALNLNEQQGSVPHPEPQAIFTEPPQPQPPKKSKKGLIITLVIILLLAAAGAVAYFLYFQPKNTTVSAPTDNQTQEETTPADTTDYAKVLIDKVLTAEKALVSTYPTIKTENTDARAPAFKYGSNEYYITGDFGYSILVTDTASATDPAKFTASTVASANTTLTADTSLSKNETESSAVYQNNLVICSVSTQGYPLTVSCANKRDYTSRAEEIKPFADALFVAQGNTNKSNTVLGDLKLFKKADGYASAQVSVGGFEGTGGYAGLFYGKDNNWVFWKGTQSLLPCQDYDNFALQTSFLGDTCYDESTKTESTVKLSS